MTTAKTNGSSESAIPIVDFAKWTSSSAAEEKLSIAKDLVAACRDVGFVYIINHGVSEELLGQAFKMTKQLYDLPREEKMKAPHPPTWAHHRGYSWPGLEKVSSVKSDGKDDGEVVGKLREIGDFKVIGLLSQQEFCEAC